MPPDARLPRTRLSVPAYIDGVRRGHRATLARAITLVESERADDAAPAADLLDAILPHTGRARRIAITGVPGAGKSTLIDAIRRRLAGRLIVAVSGTGTVRADRPTPDLLLVERTGESAAATFSPDLVDATIGVLDLAAADGADAAARWRLLVVSKLDTKQRKQP